MSTQIVTSSNLVTPTTKQVITASVSSVLGWGLDFFDLLLVLFVAPVIGKVLFPSDSQMLSIAAVYAGFGVTILFRPLGSIIFGHYADKHGRKKSMIIAVVGVGIITALMGALPTYAQAGLLAPVMFLLLRLVQGVFVGGVSASTHTIGMETVPQKWRGMMSGFVAGGGVAIGSLLASFSLWFVSSLVPEADFPVYGWRLMFLCGLITSVFGLILFNKLEESPLWVKTKLNEVEEQKKVNTPIKELFSSKYRRIMLANMILVACSGTLYYLTLGYLPTFLKLFNKVSAAQTGQIMMLASVIAFLSAVAIGHLSESIGRRKAFLLIAVIDLFVVPFLYFRLMGLSTLPTIVVLVLLLGLFGNAAYAPLLAYLTGCFPTRIRATGTSLSWNLGGAICGFTPTFVTMASPTVDDIPSRLIMFIIGALVILLICVGFMSKTQKEMEDMN